MHGLPSPFTMILVSLTLVLLLGSQSAFALRDSEVGSQNAIRRHARRPQGSDPNHGLSRRFHNIAELGSQSFEARQSLLEVLENALDDTTFLSSSPSQFISESTESSTSSTTRHHNSTRTSTRTRTHTSTHTHTRIGSLKHKSTASDSSAISLESASHTSSRSRPTSSALLSNTHSSSDSVEQDDSKTSATTSSHAHPSHTRVAQIAHHTFGSSSSSSGSHPDSESEQDTEPDFFSFVPVVVSRTHTSAAALNTGLLGHLFGDGGDSASATRSEAARPTQHSSADGGSFSSDSSDSSSSSEEDPSKSDSSDSSSGDSSQESTSTSSASFAEATSLPDTLSGGDGSTKGDGTTSGEETSTRDSSSDGASSATSSSPSSTASATVPTSSHTVHNGDGGSGVSPATNSSTSTASASTVAPTSTASQSSDSASNSSASQSPSSSFSSTSASALASSSSASTSNLTSSSSTSASNWASSSSTSTSASSSATTNPYWYANTQSLNLAPASTSSYAPPVATQAATTDSGGVSTTSATGSSSDPQNYPSVIVPSVDSLNQPSDTTSIALLFKDGMTWTWVISQADLTAQIFAFMPSLIAKSIGIDVSNVTTVKLSSYADSSTTSLTDSRTMYMAFIPTESVEDLQAMVANVSSPFYTDALVGAPQELAKQVDSSFNILVAAGQTVSSASDSSSNSSSGQTTLRKGLMGVGCSLAGCAVAALGFMLWKRRQQNKIHDGDAATSGLARGQTIRSFQGGQRETWLAEPQDQDHTGHGDMQEVWTPSPYSDGFGGHVAVDPFQDQIHAGGAYVNMNRASRMTERSAYSDWSHMTEAQRIQYEYESSRRSYHSGSSQSGSHGEHSAESAGFSTSYQDDYQIPPTHDQQDSGRRVSPTPTQNRRRGSVASSIIGRPQMVGNSVLL